MGQVQPQNPSYCWMSLVENWLCPRLVPTYWGHCVLCQFLLDSEVKVLQFIIFWFWNQTPGRFHLLSAVVWVYEMVLLDSWWFVLSSCRRGNDHGGAPVKKGWSEFFYEHFTLLAMKKFCLGRKPQFYQKIWSFPDRQTLSILCYTKVECIWVH